MIRYLIDFENQITLIFLNSSCLSHSQSKTKSVFYIELVLGGQKCKISWLYITVVHINTNSDTGPTTRHQKIVSIQK